MAFRKALAVRPQNSGKMRKLRHRQAQSFVQGHLLGCVGKMVIAAYDMGDLHLRIINHHHVVVNRHSVGAHDDRIADRFTGELHVAMNNVMELNGVLGNLQADGGRLARMAPALHLRRIEIAAFS